MARRLTPIKDFSRLKNTFGQLCAGVRALHRSGHLHRDLKPGNVLVARDGTVILLEFGLVAKLTAAGFGRIEIEPTRVYSIEDARTFLLGQDIDVEALAPQVEGKFISAFVRAVKPAGCCASSCCS